MLFALGLLLVAAVGGCTEEQCLGREEGSDSQCAERLCIAAEPSLRIADDVDSQATLACNGCEQELPTEYVLSAGVRAPSLLGLDSSGVYLRLRLKATWNRELTAESLNASLMNAQVDGSAVHLSDTEQTGLASVKLVAYAIEPGDVLAAELVNDRARLTLRGRLNAATLREGCDYTESASATDPARRVRTFTVDLPYRKLPMELALVASAPVICAGECVELSARVSHGTAPFTFDWDHDLPPGPGPHRSCPGRTTSYTLRATDSSLDARVASVTVAVRANCNGQPAAPVPVEDCSAELESSMAVGARLVPASNGDVYLLGSFTGDVSFGADALRNFTLNPEAGGFIAKYSGCSYAWSRNLGQGRGEANPVDIARDSHGDLVLTGTYNGPFDPLRDVPLSEPGRLGSFIGRLSPDGEVLYEARLPIGLWSSILNADDSVLLVASAVNGVDLGQGALVLDEDYGPVLVKLDRDFRVVFTRALGGAYSVGAALGRDGTIHLVGHAKESLRVEGAPALTQGSPFDFAVRLSATGNLESQVILPPRPAHEQDPYTFEDISLIGVDASGALLATRTCSGHPLPPARQELRIDRAGSLAFEATRPSYSNTMYFAELMGFDVAESGLYSVFMSRAFNNSDNTRILRRELVREEYDLQGQLTATHIIIPDVGSGLVALRSAQVTPRGELLVSWGDQDRQRFRLIPQP